MNVSASWAEHLVKMGASRFLRNDLFCKMKVFCTLWLFWDSDRILIIEITCGHYTLNLFSPYAAISISNWCSEVARRWTTRRFLKKVKKLKSMTNQIVRFSASNNIDFCYRKIHMAKEYFPKTKEIVFKHSPKSKTLKAKSFKRMLRESWHRYKTMHDIEAWIWLKTYFKNCKIDFTEKWTKTIYNM